MALAGKHLVIFGCGYVGRALAAAARVAGAEVTALTRNPRIAAELSREGIEVVVGDLAASDWHSAITRPVDFVVNCVSSGGGTPEDFQRSYVRGMQSVLAWLAARPPAVATFVYTSSTSVYPQGSGVIVDETAATGAGPFNGQILLESENLLRAASANAVRRSFVLRLAGIYGPERHYLLNQLRDGATVLAGDPAHRVNLAHRDDIVAAIIACLNAPPAITSSVFNVADGAPAPKGEVVRWLAEQLGVPAPGFDGSTSSHRRAGQPMPDRIISSAKIQRELGWRPRFPDYRAGYAELLRSG